MALGDRIKSRRKAAGKGPVGSKLKNWVSSHKGDANALNSDRLGIGRSFLNKFDQRLQDGLDDLLAGLLGVRTSNVADIKGEVADAKSANARKRQDAANRTDHTSSRRTPHTQVPPLVFPEAYFNEKNERVGHIANVDESDATWNGGIGLSGQQIQRNKKERARAQQTAFPNSIHFRSLPRRLINTEEVANAGKALFGEDKDQRGFMQSKRGTTWRDKDVGKWGTITQENNLVYDIFLYLPHNLSDNVKVDVTDGKADIISTIFARLTTLMSRDGGGDQAALKDIMSGPNADMGEIMQILKDVLPGGELTQLATGAVSNPMKFQIFKGVPFRTYNYKFTLRPQSAKDSETIRQIIRALKWSTLPGIAGENGRIWTFPNEWAIGFQGPIKKWIDYPLTSICTGVEVDYSGGGAYTLMEDGAPGSIELTVSFTETVQLNRQRYNYEVAAPGMGDAQRKSLASDGTYIIGGEYKENKGAD